MGESFSLTLLKLKMRGFFEIGIYCPNKQCNYGTLLRSAYQLGASGVFVIGAKFKKQSSDTCNTDLHVPTREYSDFESFLAAKPINTPILAIESPQYGGKFLKNYVHPERAVYLLGNEISGLPKSIVEKCQGVISIESDRTYSYNVAMAGTIVMYDRFVKKLK